jgi:alpha-mannosidase
LIQPILLKTTYSCHDQLEYLGKTKLHNTLSLSDVTKRFDFRPDDPEIRWSQTGRHFYRFSLSVDTGNFDPSQSFRYAMEHQTPFFPFVHYEFLSQFPHLVKEKIKNRLGNSHRFLPESISFLSCESETVISSWVKKAEDGEGIIIRCFEAGGKQSPVKFKTHPEISEAWETNIIEYDQSKLPVKGNTLSTTLEPFKIETIRVKFKGNGSPWNLKKR